MKRERLSGILFHPTSLPNPCGIGDLGSEAYAFADFLVRSGASLWQVLPLGPTGYGNSPYSARSSFAGNEMLIDLSGLSDQGYLPRRLIDQHPEFDRGRIDYGSVQEWKMHLLKQAAENFLAHHADSSGREFTDFCASEAFWLDDYALFMAVYEHYQDSRWYSIWDRDIGYREPEAMARWSGQKAHQIMLWKVLQYFFFTQWDALRSYVNERGVKLIGDIPIFAASDSVDTWANLHLFKTDDTNAFSFISGVPPDFFSETGQLWGTPVYDWEANEQEGFAWWLKRVDAALRLTDIIRIDHFRGFAACWEVPAGEKTAVNGKWVPASGAKLLAAIGAHRGDIPIIAEDLGVVTPDVEALRDGHGLPGMKVFQFSFDYLGPGRLDPNNDFLPHNYQYNCVAYTGTHDNDTTAGWYKALPESYKDLVRRYLASSDDDIVWSMIRMLMSSCARYVIIPMQDLLELDTESRMNTPATAGPRNWSWRLHDGQADHAVADRFRELGDLYGRAAAGDQGLEG